jgi:bifunctional DNA-binding transcriptional regulator/antitoxin component of YhaV-PrlF toxin-antitoxin module
MQTQAARLSGNGNIALPKDMLARYRWNTGQELEVIDTGAGLLLRTAPAFKAAQLDDVVGILKHSGKTVSLDEMQEAVRQGALERK